MDYIFIIKALLGGGARVPSPYFSTRFSLPTETSDPAHLSFVVFLFSPSSITASPLVEKVHWFDLLLTSPPSPEHPEGDQAGRNLLHFQSLTWGAAMVRAELASSLSCDFSRARRAASFTSLNLSENLKKRRPSTSL